jgi:hypothetical protein
MITPVAGAWDWALLQPERASINKAVAVSFIRVTSTDFNRPCGTFTVFLADPGLRPGLLPIVA